MLKDFDLMLDLLKFQSIFGSNKVMLAFSPISITGQSMFKIFLGFILILSTISFMLNLPNKFLHNKPKKLSSPIIPNFACSNSLFLSSSKCGLWSEVITSIIFNFRALIREFISLLSRSGGRSLKFVLKSFSC